MSDSGHGPAGAPDEPRLARGARLALDVGTVRIGVAASDPDGILATPHATVPRQEGADVRRVAGIVGELGARVVYVGLPRTLAGGDSASTALARAVAGRLAQEVAPVPVHLVDERLSTVDAARMMRAAGRSARSQRDRIDAAAAVVILQTALDVERATARRAGEPVGLAQWTPDAPTAPERKPRKPRHRAGADAPTQPHPTPRPGPPPGPQEGTP